MTLEPVALLLADLGVMRPRARRSRMTIRIPEAQFKTLGTDQIPRRALGRSKMPARTTPTFFAGTTSSIGTVDHGCNATSIIQLRTPHCPPPSGRIHLNTSRQNPSLSNPQLPVVSESLTASARRMGVGPRSLAAPRENSQFLDARNRHATQSTPLNSGCRLDEMVEL